MVFPRANEDPSHAWAPFEPSASEPWDRSCVAHLHRRAGLGARWETLERDIQAGPATSIDRLLEGEPTASVGSTAAEFDALMDAMAGKLAGSATDAPIRGAWLYRMIHTPHPLREVLTLCWHDHFATSNSKVQNPALMQRQNDLFRAHALGDFKSLLSEIGKDPAMLVWLDASANRKAKPNENYAREVMELFALGRGMYGEQDIREAARAFTGWFVDRNEFKEVPAQHDDGPKTILGRSGRFGGDDVPAILLDQPACAEFVCGKLYRLFVSEVDVPLPSLIAPLAKAFRDSGYNVSVPVKMILRSNLFFARSSRRRRVKGPVEYAVGTLRALNVVRPTVSADALAEVTTQMGQSLFNPPSVAGWDGGAAWINTTTMLARTNFILGLASPSDKRFGGRFKPEAFAMQHGATKPREVASFYVDLLAQDAFEPKILDKLTAAALQAGDSGAARAVATLVLTAPEFQLA